MEKKCTEAGWKYDYKRKTSIPLCQDGIQHTYGGPGIEIRTMQDSAIMNAILQLNKQEKVLFVGKIYEEYIKLCKKRMLKPLLKSSVTNHIEHFEEMGAVKALILSGGRYGRIEAVEMALHDIAILKVLEKRCNGIKSL